MSPRGPLVAGTADPAFEGVRRTLEAALADRLGKSAAVAVYQHGVRKVDLWGGPGYEHDSLQLLFSVTKALTAVAVLRLSEEGVVDLDAPVASVWPEFGQAGKDRIPIRWLLSHRAGLPTVDAELTFDDLVAGSPVVHALEAQAPYWEPGSAHGYHLWTMGFLAGEVVRRATGESVGTVFARVAARPLGLDCWIGLPAEIEPRVAPIRMDEASATAPSSPAMAAARADPTSLPSRVNANPEASPIAWNSPAVHRAEIPAGNGVGDARSLARLIAACIGEVDGVRLLQARTLARATEPQSEGPDLVGLESNRFGLGFFLAFPRLPFGGPRSFGHDGLGGCVVLADPDDGLAFAYTTDTVPENPGADPLAWRLLEAVRSGLG